VQQRDYDAEIRNLIEMFSRQNVLIQAPDLALPLNEQVMIEMKWITSESADWKGRRNADS
jgi:hypothetical protein